MHRISHHAKRKKKREFIFLLFTIMYLICEGLFSTILFCILLFLIVFRYSFLSNAIKLDKPSLFPSPVSDSLFSSHAFSVTWCDSVYQWVKVNGLHQGLHLVSFVIFLFILIITHHGQKCCGGRWSRNTCNLLTYLLTPWSRVLLEKLASLQLVKKFPAFYGTRRFLTAHTSARHLSLSWALPIQSS